MPEKLNLNEIVLPNETKHQIYVDAAQPTISETGKLLGRLPRLINAALSPLDCWILQREHNVAETKKNLEKKLESIDPEKIVTPAPYIAVPALQSISYCINSQELYDLYANLLAKSMYSDTQNQVHPAFVETIKQMSPNDALTLNQFAQSGPSIPAAMLSIVLNHNGIHLASQPTQERIYLELLTNIHPDNMNEQAVRVSIDNLKRLGLIALDDISLSPNSLYSFVKETQIYSDVSKDFENLNKTPGTANRIRIQEKCLSLTPYGRQFCSICIKGL